MSETNEKRNFSNTVTFTVRDKNGDIKRQETTTNVITNSGLELSSRLLGEGLGGNRLSHIAVGSDGTPKTASDTSLGNEVSRDNASVSVETDTVTNDTAQFSTTFSFGSQTTIEETGLYDSATGGTLFAVTTKGPFNLDAQDSLQIVWQVRSTQ